MELCCCGNILDHKIRSRVKVWPCKCKKPQRGTRAAPPTHGTPDEVSRKQIEQRDRLGLPRVTDAEKVAFSNGWR